MHLNWYRACLYVVATSRYRTRSTKRLAYIWRLRARKRGKEKVREWRRHSLFIMWNESCFSHFFSRSLLLLLMLMRFFFLARALSLSSDVSSSKNDHPTLTYEREKKSAYTHILTHSKARSCVDLKYIENDAKLSAAYCGIRHAEPWQQRIVMIDNSIRSINRHRQLSEKWKKKKGRNEEEKNDTN